MRRFACALLLVLAPLCAQAADAPNKHWTDCAEDTDCVVVAGLCNPVAVNAASQDEAAAYYRQHKSDAKCVKKFWEPAADQVGAKCWQESCTIVGK